MEQEINDLQLLIGCEAATVWMVEGDVIYPYILFGEHTDGLRDLELPIGQGLCGRCVAENVEIISNDLVNDPRWYQKADSATGFVSKNIICLPIIVQEEVYGCVQLLNKTEGDFTEKDISICRDIVELICDKL